MGSSRGAHSPATPTETSALASDLAAQPDAHNIALPITDATPVSRSSAARAFGFEQVYPDLKDTNATAETKIDVIALHGLDAESPKTWEAWKDEQNQDSGSIFWLKEKDMLPSELPEARILAYNWNANFDKFASSDIFLGHADSLLYQLHLDRKTNSRLHCPVIFIASCFGGLLLAKALLRATDEYHRNGFREIIDHTVGVAFLGTPFRGSWRCGNIVAETRIKSATTKGYEYSRELVEYLRTGNPEKPGPLAELVQRFTELISHHCFNFKVACFYETKQTAFSTKRRKLPQGYVLEKLDSSGYGTVVSRDSACLDGVECIALNVRHNMMHKFNNTKNNDYHLLVGKLKDFAGGLRKS